MWWQTIFDMPTHLRQAVGGESERALFENTMRLTGKAFRDVPGRKTSRITLLNHAYFIKQHFGVGWKEIIKNLVSGKVPVLGAMTEVNAIRKIHRLGIATTPLVAYGQKGVNPAKQQSFVMTEDLGDIVSLEDLCADWQRHPPAAAVKRQLIIAVAKLAKTIHENGVNHRDFYLCHLCLDKQCLYKQDLTNINLYLIDLHRVLIHNKPSRKMNMKDIAALYFSSMDVGLTVRDYLRFKHYYFQQPPEFWQQVDKRAQGLYAKFNSRKFQDKLRAERDKLQ